MPEGGYRPAWISYDTIIAELLDDCNTQHRYKNPQLYDAALTLMENLYPFFSPKDKEKDKKLQKELEEIDGRREEMVKEEYMRRKSNDVNAQDWNRNLLLVIGERTDESLSFEKGCAIWKFCLRSDAFKRATREFTLKNTETTL